MLSSLTDFESIGLHSEFCLADGHAYQDMPPAFNQIIKSLPEIWHDVITRPIYEIEKQCSVSFASLIASNILKSFDNYKICPTASNSIDLIGAYLKALEIKTILVEPTFDNLALLLKRRAVKLDAINDRSLFNAAEINNIEITFPELKNYGALFIVHPNNPTGLSLSESAFKNLVTYCKSNNMILLIDNCFRLYRKEIYDDYKILIDSSVSFITLEDTGKVWPTQDLKASLIYYSTDMKKLFDEIYNEVYLCVSRFSLAIISAFFEVTAKIGLQETILNLIETRRAMLRKTIQNSMFSVSAISENSNLPVEWLVCNSIDKNDFTICRELRELDVAILPGRQFYWNSFNLPKNQQNIRISLLKQEKYFLPGLEILKKYCRTSFEINSKNNRVEFASLLAS